MRRLGELSHTVLPASLAVIIQDDYEQLPYASSIYPDRHIDHLWLRARLHGLTPIPTDGCRVLAVACSDAGQIVQSAYDYPESQFLGVDISASSIERGQSLIETIGLTNLALIHGDITKLDQELGLFDYITVYGIFSWLPLPMQDALLAVCKRLLSENGICVIHYRTYPGSYAYETLRTLARLHVATTGSLQERLGQAANLIAFLQETLPSAHPMWREVGNWDVGSGALQDDAQFYHEYLGAAVCPTYFSDLVARASAHHLSFVCDMCPTYDWQLPSHRRVGWVLRRIDNRVKREQYMDILTNNSTRYSLFCHQGQVVHDEMSEEVIATCLLLPRLERLAEHVQETSVGLGLSSFGVRVLQLIDPHRSQGISYERLIESLRDTSTSNTDHQVDAAMRAEVLSLIRIAYEDGLLRLWPKPFTFTQVLSERPMASLVARAMSDVSGFPAVVNRRHESVSLDDRQRRILHLLNGAHSRQEIARLSDLPNAEVNDALRGFAEAALLIS